MGDQYLSALAVKAVVALQKDDLELCIALARRVEVQLGQNAAFLEVAVLITAALAQVVRGQGDQARRLLGLAQQRNHFLEGRYLDMQLANVEVILALEQGQVKQAQLLIERLRQRARPLFEKSRSALALPTITEALTAYYRIELDGLEERLGWALGHVDVINPIDFYAQDRSAWRAPSACWDGRRRRWPAWRRCRPWPRAISRGASSPRPWPKRST